MAEKMKVDAVNEADKARYRPARTAADTVEPFADQVAAVEGRDAAYKDYAEALDNHQEREDIETLANRRVRFSADSFSAADHLRAKAGEAKGSDVETKHDGTDITTPPNQKKGKE